MKLKKDVIIFMILFIVISVVAIYAFGSLGLLFMPVMLLLIFVYYNIDAFFALMDSKKRKRFVYNQEKNEDTSINDNNSYSENDTDDGNYDLKEDIKSEDKDVLEMKKVKKTKKKNVRSKKKKKENVKGKWLKRFIVAILLLGIIGVLLGASFMVYIAFSAGEFDPNKLASQDQSVVYDKDGEIMATLGLEKRESVKYEDSSASEEVPIFMCF